MIRNRVKKVTVVAGHLQSRNGIPVRERSMDVCNKMDSGLGPVPGGSADS